MSRVMLSCGEPSGDLYAGQLTEALKARRPGIDVFGFGGPRCEQAGMRMVGRYTGLSVTGLTEALRVLPATFAMLRRLVRAARETRPDVLVLVDYPDFNFRLMAAIARAGVPIVYYVTPQVWAWRASRMKTLQRHLSLALPIFPFEAPLYQAVGIPVQFLGHPLVDAVQAPPADPAAAAALQAARRIDLGLAPDRPTLALLPGSRHNEISRLAPVLAAALPLVAARVAGLQAAVACAPGHRDEEFAALATASPAARLIHGRVADVLTAADVVITASGTATAETALHERPMVVVYKVSPLTYRLGKPLLTVDTYAMANLVAGERVVAELMQEDCTPEAVAAETLALLTDRDRWERTRAKLAGTRAKLGPPGSIGRVAEAVLGVADRVMPDVVPGAPRPAAAPDRRRRRDRLTVMRVCMTAVLILLLAAPWRAGALTVLPATFDELVRESQAVVYGRVLAVEGRWTADRRTIESVVTLAAVEHFKGAATETTTFRVPGGEAGGRRLIVAGAPAFTPGDAVVVFLRGQVPAMPSPVGLSLGVYRVAPDPRSGALLVVPTPVRAADAPGRVMRGGPGRSVQALAAFGAAVRAVKEQP